MALVLQFTCLLLVAANLAVGQGGLFGSQWVSQGFNQGQSNFPSWNQGNGINYADQWGSQRPAWRRQRQFSFPPSEPATNPGNQGNGDQVDPIITSPSPSPPVVDDTVDVDQKKREVEAEVNAEVNEDISNVAGTEILDAVTEVNVQEAEAEVQNTAATVTQPSSAFQFSGFEGYRSQPFPTVSRGGFGNNARLDQALEKYRAAIKYQRLILKFRLGIIESQDSEEFVQKVVELIIVASKLNRVPEAVKFLADLVITSNYNPRMQQGLARAVGYAVGQGFEGEQAVQDLLTTAAFGVSNAQATITDEDTKAIVFVLAVALVLGEDGQVECLQIAVVLARAAADSGSQTVDNAVTDVVTAALSIKGEGYTYAYGDAVAEIENEKATGNVEGVAIAVCDTLGE